MFQIAHAAVTDVFNKRRLVEKIERECSIIDRYLTQDQAFGFQNLHRLFAERRDLAGFSEHFVDFVEMKLFENDHLAGVFFEQHGFSFGLLEQLIICLKRRFFLFEAFAQDVADIVFMRLKQSTDLQ